MPKTVQDTGAMISGMSPVLEEDEFVFCTTHDPMQATAARSKAIGAFEEREGLSVILKQSDAKSLGFKADTPMRCITLKVYSALDGVGLTSAVSAALAAQAIPCNIVAAYHHDYVFVPAQKAERAIQILQDLQKSARPA